MFCTNCGAPMPEQDRFCRYCGTPGTETGSYMPPPAPPAGYGVFVPYSPDCVPMQPGQLPMQPYACPPPWLLPPLPPAPHIGWEPDPVTGKQGSQIVPIICMVCLAAAGFALFLLL